MIQNAKRKIQNTNGFTLIEALTLLFIFSIITLTFYQVSSAGISYIMDSKSRLGAISLANERMEIVRNLSYNDIGTVGGPVDGNIPQEQVVTENGKAYTVKTEVSYIDDTLDGVYPSDPVYQDYKRVVIIVSWSNGQTGNGEVRLASRFVPPGLETANEGDGILSINVFSDQPGGTGIPNSTVHVTNAQTGLNTTLETDSSGNLLLMGSNISESIQQYEITVTKSGYETVSTMPPYPDTAYIPAFVHASVISGSINVANIIQNELSDLKIKTEDNLGQSIGSVNFALKGGKILGVGATFPNDPIYNLDGSYSTGSNGEKDFSDISPGGYTITTEIPENYEPVITDPGENFSLLSNTPLTVLIKMMPKNATSLLVKVQKDDNGILMPISGAEVKLTNASGYDQTATSASNGTACFPVSADLFIAGDYTLTIKASGFVDDSHTVTINENELKIEPVTLTPS